MNEDQFNELMETLSRIENKIHGKRDLTNVYFFFSFFV